MSFLIVYLHVYTLVRVCSPLTLGNDGPAIRDSRHSHTALSHTPAVHCRHLVSVVGSGRGMDLDTGPWEGGLLSLVVEQVWGGGGGGVSRELTVAVGVSVFSVGRLFGFCRCLWLSLSFISLARQ